MTLRYSLLSTLLLLFANNALSYDDGYALSTVIWDSPDIPVCWEDYSDSTSDQRTWVRDAVRESWESNSRVNFTGWGECSVNSLGIRIDVADDQPHVLGLGDRLDGIDNGMRLNFTYNNWSEACKGQEENCSKSIAVHEFGHALGFAHEQNRDDTPDTCPDDPQGTNGDTTVGDWDIDSVMNYCNPRYNNDGKLSNTDVQMVQKFYRSPTRLKHVNSAQCTYGKESTSDANHWGCWNDPNMSYRVVNIGSNNVHLVHKSTGKCLYVKPEGNVGHWGCWNDPYMSFALDATSDGYHRIRGTETGRCLFASGGNGGKMSSYGCWGDPNFRFDLDLH